MQRLVLIALLLIPTSLHAGQTVVKFKLNDIDGKAWSVDDCKDKKAVVVVFIGTQCPVNNAFMPTLVALEKDYRDKGVQFVAINANEHDSLDTIKQHAKKYGLTFPVLRDEKHVTATRFGAERHPTAFVLDAEHKTRYEDASTISLASAINAGSRRATWSSRRRSACRQESDDREDGGRGLLHHQAAGGETGEVRGHVPMDVSHLQNRCGSVILGQIGPMPLFDL